MNFVGFCIGDGSRTKALTAVTLILTEDGNQMQMQLLMKWETPGATQQLIVHLLTSYFVGHTVVEFLLSICIFIVTPHCIISDKQILLYRS